jgi:adenosylhomocysteine nucleosidase
MTTGIIGALPEEIAHLRDAMALQSASEHYNTTFYRGVIEGRPVVLACASVGKVNAALCASVMIREMGAQAIVNLGIAGAMDKRLGVMDVVLSTDAVMHDADPIMEKFYPFRLTFSADEKLLSAAEAACARMPDVHAFTGRVATGDCFVSAGPRRERIICDFSPLCVEMEGAAVAQACYMNGVPFLIIRTISDNADEEAAISYEEFKDGAAAQSAKIVLEMLKDIS